MPSENSPNNDLTSADILARLQQESAERQRLAAALEESERRYRTLVSEVRDYAIYAMDTHGRALTWNEGVQSVLGYQEAEFLGSAVELPFLPEDIAAGVPTRELETARREGVASDDRWLRKKDGTRFYAVGRTTRKLDGAGRLIGFTKVFRDETQRVLAEEKRRTEEARFRTLVQNLRDYAIFMLNAAGIITEWTEGAELVKGYKAQEVLGKHLEVFYTAEDREAKVPHRELEQAAQQGRAEREGWRITRSGERIWVNEIATAIYDSAGSLTGYTKISRNLTEKKRAEDSLREADRRKDQFLATLAHELRNPLAPLRNGLAIIRMSDKPNSPLQPTLQMMERQLAHLVRLVDDLLDVARISTGKVSLRKGLVSLQQVLAASIEATHSLIESRQHQLTVAPETGPEDLVVEGDFDRLAQVFSNLISNAAKYMEPGGKISIHLERQSDAVTVTVRDQGIGIPEAELQHVFDIFSQVRNHQHHALGGLGIGLSLVKSLVHLHGGRVYAHSGGPGLGSEFVVKLPLASTATVSRTANSNSEAIPLPRQRILVVDDNEDAANSLAMLLTLRGHDCFVAYDGLDAIDKVTRLAPDIVLMDLGMPRLDGIEATKRLRAIPGGEKLKIMALTGWGAAQDRARTRAAGFDLHLVKPVDTDDLDRMLQMLSPADPASPA